MKLTATGHRSDPRVAWATLGDTDTMNRVGGNGRVLEMDIAADATGYPEVVGVMEGPLGTRLPFREVGVSWSWQRFYDQERVYDSPFVKRTRYRMVLHPDGDGVIPEVEVEIDASNALARTISGTHARSLFRAWKKVLDDLPPPGGLGELPPEPPDALPRLAAGVFARWAEAGSAAVVERVRRHLATAPAITLRSLRPFALADRWGADREEVLVSMLRGVKAGALELYWSVRCPRCYGQVSGVDTLGDLADHATCASCRVGFAADLSDNVEVVFAPHPSLVPRAHERFCTLFPTASPELQGVFTLPSGGDADALVSMEAGAWRLGAGGDRPDVAVEATRAEAPRELVWSPELATDPRAVHAGDVRLRLRNSLPGRVRVLATRAQASEPAVPASLLTTLPEFRRTLGHQVLAPDLRISVRQVSLLFTDLSGSTAMYEEAGDAEAFALVRDHFRLLREIVEEHGGVVVKTIGDAVMAAFHRPERALAAAFSMQDRFEAWVAGRGLASPPGLRVGVHTGPALAVHTDQAGLDYFGRTVNLAARTEGQAGRGAVAWSDAVHDDPAVADWLAARGIAAEPVDATLKGIRDQVRLYRARPPAPG